MRSVDNCGFQAADGEESRQGSGCGGGCASPGCGGAGGVSPGGGCGGGSPGGGCGGGASPGGSPEVPCNE